MAHEELHGGIDPSATDAGSALLLKSNTLQFQQTMDRSQPVPQRQRKEMASE